MILKLPNCNFSSQMSKSMIKFIRLKFLLTRTAPLMDAVGSIAPAKRLPIVSVNIFPRVCSSVRPTSL